jgi:indoleacetamide hydrolase
MNLCDLTAREIVQGISNRQFSSVDVAQSLIAQAERLAHLNAFIKFDADAFLAAAQKSDEQFVTGADCGPLHGLPIVVKDNIDVVGFATTAATPALVNHYPKAQGPVVQSLIDAGAVVMGKANMHELAFSPGISRSAEDEEIKYGGFGNAHNPYDLERSPAGSSTGTAAAIGARIAPAGLGSDTGGSVRNPAAWCGISGLRPTIQRYSQDLVVPISWTRDTIGPMARSVDDLILFDEVITGERDLPTLALSDLTLGINREYFCDDADPEVVAVFDREIERLKNAGVQVKEIEIPDLFELVAATGHAIAMYEIVRALPKYLIASKANVDFDQIVDQIAASSLGQKISSIRGDQAISEEVYLKSMNETRPKLQAVYAQCFIDNEIDALVFPSSLTLPFNLQNPGVHRHKGQDISAFAASGHNVQPASLCGSPGLTVAAGLTTSGLPVALGFDGPTDSDRKLLTIGRVYEAIRPDVPGPPL